jgi:hypothetical protein
MVDPVVPCLVPYSAAGTASSSINLIASSSINLATAVSSHAICSRPPTASRCNHAAHKSGHNAGLATCKTATGSWSRVIGNCYTATCHYSRGATHSSFQSVATPAQVSGPLLYQLVQAAADTPHPSYHRDSRPPSHRQVSLPESSLPAGGQRGVP